MAYNILIVDFHGYLSLKNTVTFFMSLFIYYIFKTVSLIFPILCVSQGRGGALGKCSYAGSGGSGDSGAGASGT